MTNPGKLQITLWLPFAILIFGSACQKAEIIEISTPTSTTELISPSSVPTQSTFIISEPQPASKVQESIKLDISPPEPTLEPEPLDFSAHQLYSDPSWRPALYPVPLALTTFDHFYFTRPFAANEPSWPVEDYRYGGSFFEDVVHRGMDIKIPVGTPVLAAGPGKVVWSGYGLFSGRYDPDDPYGQAVMIRHSFGHNGSLLYTVYAHLDRVDVKRDQYVEAGELIGFSGETGITSGPHLHFEVRFDESGQGFFSTQNPELWLVPPQGWGVLAGRVMNTGGRKVEGQLVIVRPLEGEQFWRANSYHRGNLNYDAYYQENLVISDLPAGRYEIVINYLSRIYTQEIEIYPGLVSYFSFRGRSGFTTEPPPIPGADFDPPQSP
jgi:murein DD-endopeptidase MepM/ murein hydrolase activator NlpD